jgi:hypothetical protein
MRKLNQLQVWMDCCSYTAKNSAESELNPTSSPMCAERIIIRTAVELQKCIAWYILQDRALQEFQGITPAAIVT